MVIRSPELNKRDAEIGALDTWLNSWNQPRPNLESKSSDQISPDENKLVSIADRLPDDMVGCILPFLPLKEILRPASQLNHQWNGMTKNLFFKKNMIHLILNKHPQWKTNASLADQLIANPDTSQLEQYLEYIFGFQMSLQQFIERCMFLRQELVAVNRRIWQIRLQPQKFSEKFYPGLTRGELENNIAIFLKDASFFNKKSKDFLEKASLEDLIRSCRFNQTAHYLSELIADFAMLFNILYDANGVLYRISRKDQILRLLGDPERSRYITSQSAFLIFCMVEDCLEIKNLVEDPDLRCYIDNLSVEEIISVIRITGQDESFLSALINSPVIRDRLSSTNYVDLAKQILLDGKPALSSNAAIVLSVPEVIKKLKDADLLILMKRSCEKMQPLLNQNHELRQRMTGDLWSKLLKMDSSFRHVIVDNPDLEIHKLFSEKQLIDFIMHLGERILKNEEVFNRVNNGILTKDQIKSLGYHPETINDPEFAKIVSQLRPKQEISEVILPVRRNFYPRFTPITPPREEKSSPPQEEKSLPVSDSSHHTKLEQAMTYTLGVASALLITGTSIGIATFFVPTLLAATISLLGAAILAFAAYGVMKWRHSLFSNSANPQPSSDLKKSTHEGPALSLIMVK